MVDRPAGVSDSKTAVIIQRSPEELLLEELVLLSSKQILFFVFLNKNFTQEQVK